MDADPKGSAFHDDPAARRSSMWSFAPPSRPSAKMGRMPEPRARDELFDYKGKTLYEWLPAVVERVAERFDPLRIVVFGSVARGEADYDSDIDLLVVFDEVEWEEKRKTGVEIHRSLVGIPVPVDVIVTDVDEIRRRGHIVGTVLRPALRGGRVAYERP